MIVPDKTFVLVKPESIGETKTINGIIIPYQQKKTRKGEIIAIGGDVEGMQVGDMVTYFTIHAIESDGMFLVDTDEKDCRIVCVHN